MNAVSKDENMSTLQTYHKNEAKPIRSLTPVQARMVLKAAKHWRSQHEQKINDKLSNLRDVKRKRNIEAEKEVDQIVARQVPFDILTNEWFKGKNITTSQRVYLLEKLIPTLVLGVEKLVTVAARKNLIDAEEPSKNFNPINFLAQFLMRNNPRYSNFAEAVPYARSINKMLDDLKKEAYNQEENRLAKMKTSARRRKEERKKTERFNLVTGKGRAEIIQDLFLQWVEELNGVILLHLIQNALKSFKDYVNGLPEDQRSTKDLDNLKEIGDIDTEGKMITFSEFLKLIGEFSKDFSEEFFAEFVKHMNNLATEYRTSAHMESIRMILANLFIACDHGDTGLLDRKRVLKLLESFYDNVKEVSTQLSFLNPRKWPVVDIDEQEDNIQDAFAENVFLNSKPEEQNRTTQNSVSPEKPLEVVTEKETEQSSSSMEKNEATVDQKIVNEKSDGSATNDADARMTQSTNGTVSDNSDQSKFAHVDVTVEMAQEIKDIIDRGSTAMETAESPVKTSRGQSVATGSIFDPSTLNQAQFVSMLEKFLGENPSRQAVEALVTFIRAGYIETEEERAIRLENARLKARSAKRRLMMDQLFDLWDVDASGYLEINEVEMVLSKWRDEALKKVQQASEVFADTSGKMSRKQFKRYIDQIVKMFPEEDCFDSLVAFLFASVERSFEERKRGEFRKKCLTAIDKSGQTSGALLEPVFKTTFQALSKDAEVNGRNKKISAYVAILEANDQLKTGHKGETRLRYVSCTQEDVLFVHNKLLYRDMKCVSFTVVDSGKPIHVPRVIHNGGVHLWNANRKEEETEGSLVMLPLKDYEKRVIGILGIDTLPDPRDKAVFVTHEISFYQGVAKALSAAIQFIDSRRKTIKIAESAVSWILRRSPNVQEVTVYLVEPGLKASDGLVLRKMMLLRQNNDDIIFDEPPRLERKDNLFRDYLFKCIDTSETLTADAYGERHTAFPLRDAEGMAVAIVDISIGDQRQLPQHENKEILRMLKLLAAAHKEISREIAGEEKNIVLEVEKEHQEKRIDILFDRIMLQDLRDNVGRLDARAFAEIKSYKDPPKIIHDIVKAVLEIYFGGKEDDELKEKLEEWMTCKQMVNADLVNWISTFDPTASTNLAVDGEKLANSLSNVPPGAVAKHGSLPAQYLFNWAFVCLSLIEHTAKMRETRPGKGYSLHSHENEDDTSTAEVQMPADANE